MDEQALEGLKASAATVYQAQALQYFEQLKSSESGWQLCMNAINSNGCEDDRLKFYCFQVVEHYLRSSYAKADDLTQQHVRQFIANYILGLQHSTVGLGSTFVRNKAAQIISLVFSYDYPQRWPSFFTDMIGSTLSNDSTVDLYLRVLKSIDVEVINREFTHTELETQRSTLIKDCIRDSSVNDLINSLYHILVTYEYSNNQIVGLCLEVIGLYISWIDINLVANDKFVNLFVQFFDSVELREPTLDCLEGIISKGMDPLSKVKLIESFVAVMDNAGLDISENDGSEFSNKLAKLVNTFGSTLILCHSKMVKSSDHVNAGMAKAAIEKRIPLMLKCLSSEYDDISSAVCDFARDYIQWLKQGPLLLSDTNRNNLQSIFVAVVTKFKYDDSYDFDHEGELETLFQDYRKQLKTLLNNIAQLDRDLVLGRVQEFVTTTLQNWRFCSFQDCELAITLLFLLGEAFPVSHGNHFDSNNAKSNAMLEMLKLLVTSGISAHTHSAVQIQYFETVARYEKYFTYEPQYIYEVVVSFFDERGLRNTNCRICSRCAYLLSRFLKSLKGYMSEYTEDVLRRLQDLFELFSLEDEGEPMANNNKHIRISSDDQLYLYEAAALMIVSGHFDHQRKQLLMGNLVTPVLVKFEVLLDRFAKEADQDRRTVLEEAMTKSIGIVGRTSKAFSNQQTMKSCGCVQLYLDALKIFLQSLDLPNLSAEHCTKLQSSVRQYLHRMVVCLEEELLPYVPMASEALLKSPDTRSIQEFIPLINQIICKFKLSWVFQKEMIPFLHRAFVPLVQAIDVCLAVKHEQNDQQAIREKQQLRRAYYQFVATLVGNNVTEVIATLDSRIVEHILMSIVQGAVDYPDPIAQKTCFTVLKKFVEIWGKDGFVGFDEYLHNHIIRACVMAPAKNSFDLTDAQTVQALGEIALCLKTILDVKGEPFLVYLQTTCLPSMSVSAPLIAEFCHAIKQEQKIFKSYLKGFFQHIQTTCR